MPFVTDALGKTHYIPGAYTTIKVVSSLPGPLPFFLVPMLLGQADEGHPYNADALKYPEEAPFTPFKYCGTDSAAQTYFGKAADVATGLTYAKRHGGPGAFVGCMGALTRFAVPVTSTGPIVQFTLYAKKFGMPSNHMWLKAGSGTSLEITPLKNFSRPTTATASGDRRVYLKDNSWVRVGQTLYIGDQSVADAAFVVLAVGTETSSTGQLRPFIDLTSTVGAIITTATGLVYELDTAHKEVSPTFARTQDMIDWLNGTSKYLGAHKESATFTNPAAVIAIGASAPLKEISAWGTVVKGTSPAPTSADYTAFVTLMDGSAWDAFVLHEGVLPQCWCALESSSTIHGTLRDWAVEKRTEGFPISITVGCAWGDTVVAATDDTSPLHRTAALDSQDVALVAGGLDQLGSYLSHAPAVWGRRLEGGIKHNLTNDRLVYTSLEKQWDERNSGELTSLCKGGVITYRLSTSGTPGFVISEGLSTLQNNAQRWNVGTRDTCLIEQRDLCDFCDRVIKQDLDATQVGADIVDENTVAITIQARGKQLKRRGYITGDVTISSITLDDSGAGWDATYNLQLPVTTDFIVGTCNIQIGA